MKIHFFFSGILNFPYNLESAYPEYDNLFPDKTGKEISVMSLLTDKVDIVLLSSFSETRVNSISAGKAMLTQCISDTFLRYWFSHTLPTIGKSTGEWRFQKAGSACHRYSFPLAKILQSFGSMRRYLNSKLFVGDCFHIIQFSVGYFELIICLLYE